MAITTFEWQGEKTSNHFNLREVATCESRSWCDVFESIWFGFRSTQNGTPLSVEKDSAKVFLSLYATTESGQKQGSSV